MFDKRFKSHHDAEGFYKDLLVRNRSSKEALYEYLEKPLKAKDNAIYIHIPFCDKICSFCNMNRTLSTKPKDEYVDSLIKQIKEVGSKKAFDTALISAVYFGGGTPTTLLPKHFKEIIQELRKNFNLASDVEITCETTLHNLSDDHIKEFNEIGINRISIGIQTFQDEGRAFFNRTFNKEEVIFKIKKVKEEFKGIVCIDKIYNYPNETKEMLMDDIKQIIDLKIESVSFYSLMIHTGSFLSKEYDEKQFSDSQDLKFHDLFVEELLKTGNYELMELTKIVRKNCDSYKYMSIRNSNGNTIPLGKGAGGKIDKFHIYNMDFDKVMIVESTKAIEEKAHELYGLLQKDSVSKKVLSDYLSTSMQPIINNLKKEGYIDEDDNQYMLSSKGIFYGNNIGGLLTRAFLEATE
ncbi:MAG: coproporphyrinogen-III oxidase family protein [Anaerorhabdus sp.]